MGVRPATHSLVVPEPGAVRPAAVFLYVEPVQRVHNGVLDLIFLVVKVVVVPLAVVVPTLLKVLAARRLGVCRAAAGLLGGALLGLRLGGSLLGRLLVLVLVLLLLLVLVVPRLTDHLRDGFLLAD